MALGGGFFLTQNKILPGSYINFVSLARASATLSDRGFAAIPFELDWGVDNEVFSVETGDIQKKSTEVFGYYYEHEKMKNIREIFKNAKTVYCYRLNSGEKAINIYATARYSGIRGNDIRIIIQKNIDAEDYFDVITIMEDDKVDEQTVKSMTELEDNKFVVWRRYAVLSVTAGIPLVGGTNKADIDGFDYQTFLDKIEKYSFNTLDCPSITPNIIDLFVQYTKRMRDECGIKFQTVVYKYEQADYEGVISVENGIVDKNVNPASLIFWMTGASAGCQTNKSNTNKIYDGEYTIDVDYKQVQLETAMKQGKLMLHKVGDTIRILDDINTFTSITKDKNIDFNANQIIRVLDQIGNDIAVLFNSQYLGKVPNDKPGRISFWNDLTTYGKELEKIRAIEDFKPDDVLVERGNEKKSVAVTYPITPVMAMTKLYMTVIVE